MRRYKLQLQLRMIEVDEPEALPASPDMPELPPEDHDPVRRDESQISRLTAIQERMLRNMEKGPRGACVSATARTAHGNYRGAPLV